MRFDVDKIKEESKMNFQETWRKYSKLMPKKSGKSYLGGKGEEHTVQQIIQKVREVFLSLGFKEVENLFFVKEDDVYKQYGLEAPIILDRCYYLAGLPRPDIGLSKKKIEEIKTLGSNINVEELKKILRDYRSAIIESEELLEEIMERLNLDYKTAFQILDLFPKFRAIKPVSTKTTLRSHMTASWFSTLSALSKKTTLPLKLFSIGVRFRREQKLDSTHLRAHYGASCVIMDDDISLEAGKKVTKKIFFELGFKKLEFKKKKITSNYYALDTEYEVFFDDMEIANYGLYSPIALANYDIEYPVFNLGFGIERLLMTQKEIGDIREVLYPQFYKYWEMSDEQIAGSIDLIKMPKTKEGKDIAKAIVRMCEEHGKHKSPCKFLVWEDKLYKKNIKVWLIEKEENTKLCGPAYLNEIVVKDGNIYGLPETPKYKDIFTGAKRGIRYIDAFAMLAACEIEDFVLEARAKEIEISTKMIKLPSDINLDVKKNARHYITSNRKKIDVRGPMFTTVIAEIEE